MDAIFERKLTHQALADKYWVKINVIKRMAKDAKKGKPMFAKRVEKHSEKMSKINAISTEVEIMRESRNAICSTDLVRKQVFEKHELDVRNGLIAEVLKS